MRGAQHLCLKQHEHAHFAVNAHDRFANAQTHGRECAVKVARIWRSHSHANEGQQKKLHAQAERYYATQCSHARASAKKRQEAALVALQKGYAHLDFADALNEFAVGPEKPALRCCHDALVDAS